MILENNLKYSLLFEIYGALLTEKQCLYLSQYLDKNLSLSEIAQINNTSRQAVNEILKRCFKILEDYEQKLKLLEKFDKIKKQINCCLDLPKIEDNQARKCFKKVMEVL